MLICIDKREGSIVNTSCTIFRENIVGYNDLEAQILLGKWRSRLQKKTLKDQRRETIINKTQQRKYWIGGNTPGSQLIGNESKGRLNSKRIYN